MQNETKLKPMALHYCGVYRGVRAGLATGETKEGIHENKWANAINDSKKRDDKKARAMLIKALRAKAKTLSYDVVTYCQERRSDVAHARILAVGAFGDKVKNHVEAVRACRGKRVLIVDDVVRTGRTIRATAQDFYAAGATEVAALVVAKGSGYDKKTVAPPEMPKQLALALKSGSPKQKQAKATQSKLSGAQYLKALEKATKKVERKILEMETQKQKAKRAKKAKASK